MLNALSQYWYPSKSMYCQLCKTNNKDIIRICEKHYWCINCNDFIKQYYGYGCNNFCFLCRNKDWCKKMYNILTK